MSNVIRKSRINFTAKQKYEYARLMVEDGYSNKHIMQISGAGPSAVTRWKKQYQAELRGESIAGKTPLDADKCRIQELERQLADSHEDVRLLKKAAALFIEDNGRILINHCLIC